MSLAIAPDWLQWRGPRAVMAALTGQGHQAWYVGGCVRNVLMHCPDSDIDIATTAHPDQTMAAAKAAGLRAVPTGADHGTITLVVDGAGYEVTTLRRDVETDGRHARVVFSDRIEEDAARRDFTMNALYADADGRVIDPLGGLPDLLARRVRFIGDPAQRIAEDYLRILRFFRFAAWYGDPDHGPDPDGLAACAALADGLERIAAERIGQEMRKLLAACDPAPAVATMAMSGVLAHVLPGADATALAPLVALEQQENAAPDPIRRLTSLGAADPVVGLRLSRAEARRLDCLRGALAEGDTVAALANARGATAGVDLGLLRAAMTGTAPPPDLTALAERAAAAVFPVAAADLMPDYKGAELGRRLTQLRAAWIASGFELGGEELLALPPDTTDRN